MARLKSKHFVVAIIIIILISQTVALYLLYQKTSDSFITVEEKINLNNQDLQAKINTLTDSISSVSSVQSSLQEELGEIKASTSADFSGIIDREIKGVVTIKTDISQGTGFLITDDGFVVTNYHVMEGAKAAGIITSDFKQYRVTPVGVDSTMDIALLKIEGDFQALDLGDSDDVKIGEKL